MALKIRLRQQGRKNGQTYRIVVSDAKNRRDGRYIEKLGWYDPALQGAHCQVNGDRVAHWLQLGAQMSESVEALVARFAPNTIMHFRKQKEETRVHRVAKRRKRKTSTA